MAATGASDTSPRRRRTPPQILILPRRAARVSAAVAGLALALVTVFWLPHAIVQKEYGGIGVYGFVLSATIFNSRWYVSRVETRGDELHIRNWLRDQVFKREDVVGFARVEMSGGRREGWPPGKVSQIGVTVAGHRTILMNASVRGPIDTTSVDTWVSDLHRWLDPQPRT